MSFLIIRKQNSGFTIVELLIVIVVIAILASVSVIAYNGITQSAKDRTLLSDIEAVESEVVRYGTKHTGQYGNAVAWYSDGVSNSNIKVTPSSGNVIDVVANKNSYCIRAYNPNSNKKTISDPSLKGSSTTSCTLLTPSVASGGTWDSSLVGWWKFNGDTTDSTGNGNTGTVSGPLLTTGQNGQANSAYRFDGVDDYIEVSPVLTNYNSMTVSVWARVVGGPSANGTVGYIIHQGVDQYQGTSAFFLAAQTSGIGTYNADVSGYSAEADRNTTIAPNTATWRLITMTYNGTTRSIYVDGVLKIAFARSFVNSTTGSRLSIGSSPVNPSYRPAQGDIDDVRVYSRVLSGAEITALYSAGAQ